MEGIINGQSTELSPYTKQRMATTALDIAGLIASFVPATVKSRHDFSNSSGVGLIINSSSTSPTLTPAIGPLNGILEILVAKLEPNIAVSSGEQSWSTESTVLII